MDGETLYLNGEFRSLDEACIHVEDRGFQLGDGVYEVVKVMNGKLVWFEDHLERLERSLAAVRLTEASAGHVFETVLPELVARSVVVEGMVYLQVTRGTAPREFVFPRPPHPTVLAYARAKAAPTPAEILAGTSLHPVEDLRWARCDIKSTNLLAAVLAKEEAKEAGADEALFLSPEGVVREGGSSNVFALMEGVLRTHPLSNRILGGITRLHVIEIARRLGVRVEERAFTLADVTVEAPADVEVFSASTTKDMMPVVRIGGTAVGDGRAGPLTLTLLDEFRHEQSLLVGVEPPAGLRQAAAS
jgi:D-alanine transaminase